MDLGLKRIGLAYSPDAIIVTPLLAVKRKNRNQASREVKALLDHWGAKTFVVGMIMSNLEKKIIMQKRVEHFLNLVAFKGEIFYEDEDDSSLQALEMIKGVISYKRDGRIDSLAAKIILERFLLNLKR